MLVETQNFDAIPVLTDNLVFNPLNSEEFILCNYRDKHYLKINQEVYTILKLIDGKSDLTTITANFNKQSKKTISREFVHKLIYEKLNRYGILQGFESEIKPYEKPNYLNLSFIIINERLLEKIVKYFYFLFLKKIAIPIIILSLLILSSFTYNYFSIYRTFSIKESLIYFFGIMALSVTFHEIGHATAASYFGAKHGGIGGGFYLLTPVYFADVTDIWRLKKSERIIVNLAGMYFELIFCAILSIIGYLFSSTLLIILSVIICIHTLFNLNPFLRSDGFWIVSDLTNKPNLFYHAFDKTKDLLRLFKGKKLIWKSKDVFLLIYGLISVSFILIFLYYVLIQNPNSIIYFPQNSHKFISHLFSNNAQTTLTELGQLLIPLFFYFILIGFLKSRVLKFLKKYNGRKKSQIIT